MKKIEVMSDDLKFLITFSDTKLMLLDLGTYVEDAIHSIDDDEKMKELYKGLSKCVVNLISGISSVVAERDSMNDAGEALPPVLPHQLVKLRGSEFSQFLRNQNSRLKITFSTVKIDLIELDFQDLKDAYEGEEALKNVLLTCDHNTSFRQGWDYCQGRFKSLEMFCGGLATVFPGTSTIESDFSIMKWEKNDARTTLTAFFWKAFFMLSNTSY